VCAKSLQSCPTPCDPMDCSLGGSPVHSPGKNTGVGCHFPLHWNQQRIAILGLQPQLTMCKFPPQDPGLLHCRRILYQLSHRGSPRILEWVAYPVSSGSAQPRNPTGVSCIAGEFFTNWEGNGNPLQYSCLENGQGSLLGYSPWGHKELDTTEAT